MEFGAFVPQGWRHDLVGVPVDEQWATMQSVATKIEQSGYTSAWVYDHFHPVPQPTQEPVYEAWTLMAALAAVTSTVRLGQMCTCNSYRPPAYLAKVAASIDVISGGRLEMGIGAGWYEHEYVGYGYPFPKASVRIGQLREGVEIMRRMWTEDVVDYQGKHYTLEGALCRPKPVQKPSIPLWVAGGGEQLTLRVAANHADYTNFGADLDQFIHKSTVLAGHCEAVGRDYGSITRSTNFNIAIAETEAGVEELLQRYRDMYTPLFGADMTEGMLQRNWIDGGGMAGTPEQIIERLEKWQSAGMGYAIVYFAEAAYDTSGLELFASEVVPAFS